MEIKNSIGSKNTPSLDQICYLITDNGDCTDDIGQDLPSIEKREVFCAELPIYSSESYRAGMQNIKVSYILVVNYEEYNGEVKVQYKDANYSIYKTFTRTDDFIELYCEGRLNE